MPQILFWKTGTISISNGQLSTKPHPSPVPKGTDKCQSFPVPYSCLKFSVFSSVISTLSMIGWENWPQGGEGVLDKKKAPSDCWVSDVFTLTWVLLLVCSVTSSKIIVTIQCINSTIWDMIDDCYINNLTKIEVCVVFHSRVIWRSVSPKFIELCMETVTMLVPLGGTQTWRH